MRIDVHKPLLRRFPSQIHAVFAGQNEPAGSLLFAKPNRNRLSSTSGCPAVRISVACVTEAVQGRLVSGEAKIVKLIQSVSSFRVLFSRPSALHTFPSKEATCSRYLPVTQPLFHSAGKVLDKRCELRSWFGAHKCICVPASARRLLAATSSQVTRSTFSSEQAANCCMAWHQPGSLSAAVADVFE